MTVMAHRSRTADYDLRVEHGLSLAQMPGGVTECGVAAITRDATTGEVLVVCVCGLLGWGQDETTARADLDDAHREQ